MASRQREHGNDRQPQGHGDDKPPNACGADLATAPKWFGGRVDSWSMAQEMAPDNLWQSFCDAVGGMCLFPFLEADYVQNVAASIFHAVGPYDAEDADRASQVRAVFEFLQHRVHAATDGAPHTRSLSPAETLHAVRLLHLLWHGQCTSIPNTNVEMLGLAFEAAMQALDAPGFDPRAICNRVPNCAAAFRAACRGFDERRVAGYDEKALFEASATNNAVMYDAAKPHPPGSHLHTNLLWVASTLRCLERNRVPVHEATRAGEPYTFVRETAHGAGVPTPSGGGIGAGNGTGTGKHGAPAMHFQVLHGGAAVGQVTMPVRCDSVPVCRGTPGFLADVRTHTAWGLLLGSAFRLQPCPSSLVASQAKTYVVAQMARDGSGKMRYIGLLYGGRWTAVPQSDVGAHDDYAFQQLILRLREAWSARVCTHGLRVCP